MTSIANMKVCRLIPLLSQDFLILSSSFGFTYIGDFCHVLKGHRREGLGFSVIFKINFGKLITKVF